MGEAASCGRSISLTERSQECLEPIDDFLCVCVYTCVTQYLMTREEGRWEEDG